MGLVKNLLFKLASGNALDIKGIQRFSNGVLWVYYHMISDVPRPHTDNIIPRVSSDRFRSDLDSLLKQLAPLDFENFLKGIKPSKPSVMVTFDDGYREMIEIAAPILKEKGMSAIFFVNKNFIGNSSMLYRHKVSILVDKIQHLSNSTFGDLRNSLKSELAFESPAELCKSLLQMDGDSDSIEKIANAVGIDFSKFLAEERPFMDFSDLSKLKNEGFFIGGHSVSHPDYGKLSLQEQLNETVESMDILQEELELDYRIFAFPFSDRPASKQFFDLIFALPDSNRPDFLFGNSGMKKDFSPRMIQRCTMERLNLEPVRAINAEILHSGILGGNIRRV